MSKWGLPGNGGRRWAAGRTECPGKPQRYRAELPCESWEENGTQNMKSVNNHQSAVNETCFNRPLNKGRISFALIETERNSLNGNQHELGVESVNYATRALTAWLLNYPTLRFSARSA